MGSDSPFRLDGRVALVTGASRGLGAAIASALEGAGARVIRHSSRMANLAKRGESDRLIGEAGPLDILVNNAGIIRRCPTVDVTDEDWDAVIEVDLTSAFRLARAAGRGMLERGRGKIINVASLLSFQGGITVAAYAAAKGGLAQLTRALANEWAAEGVNVNAIAPGYMHTDNTRALAENPERNRQILERIPAGRWGEPADVGGAAVFLASPASDYVHGHVLVVDGGWMGR